MADEDNQGSSRRTLLLIIGGVLGAVVLIGLGLGVGYMIFGGTPSNPSAEVEQIIERSNPQAQPAEEPETEEELAAEGEEGEEGVPARPGHDHALPWFHQRTASRATAVPAQHAPSAPPDDLFRHAPNAVQNVPKAP